jgi:hypothetical protein
MGLAAVAISPMIAPLIGAAEAADVRAILTLATTEQTTRGIRIAVVSFSSFLSLANAFPLIAQLTIRAVLHDEMHPSPNSNLDFPTLGLFIHCSFGCAWTPRLNGRAISR